MNMWERPKRNKQSHWRQWILRLLRFWLNWIDRMNDGHCFDNVRMWFSISTWLNFVLKTHIRHIIQLEKILKSAEKIDAWVQLPHWRWMIIRYKIIESIHQSHAFIRVRWLIRIPIGYGIDLVTDVAREYSIRGGIKSRSVFWCAANLHHSFTIEFKFRNIYFGFRKMVIKYFKICFRSELRKSLVSILPSSPVSDNHKYTLYFFEIQQFSTLLSSPILFRNPKFFITNGKYRRRKEQKIKTIQ